MNCNNSTYLISIVGPTGIGKTALSIALAQHYKCEIISADSRQFFKEMHIGTAAPSIKELAKAKHHFIHHKSISEDYSVGVFEKDAIDCLENLYKSHNTVIIVGGSGLYIDAVINGLDFFPKVDSSIRTNLNNEIKLNGIAALQNQLKELDLESYNSIAIDNPHRLIRALEICIGTKTPYSYFLNKEKTKRNFKPISIGLMASREVIYNRINLRVDKMMQDGLLEEAENLKAYEHLNALNTVGYKELFKYFDNEWSLEFAIEEIKKNSRRFAKRQLTWFKKNSNTIWFDYTTSTNSIIEIIDKNMN